MLITIREVEQIVGERVVFSAEIRLNSNPPTPITITDPNTPKMEREWEWYFEEWLKYPFINQVRAQQTVEKIREYGESLFVQLQLDEILPTEGTSTITIEGTAEFHALHWEAIWSPKRERPVALEHTILRRKHEQPATSAILPPAETLNILLVIARPKGGADISYRTISRPLIDVMGASELPVEIDIVRPGTWSALQTELASKPVGHYHITHFDLHGSYDRNLKRAYLEFDHENEQVSHSVPAGHVAQLLKAYGVPIAILNACQSAKQLRGKNMLGVSAETSLAAQLMEAGVPLTLAMGYSVTVTAAKKLMPILYEAIFAGEAVGEGLRIGRNHLYTNKLRETGFEENIPLEDWLLPVVYQSRVVQLPQFTGKKAQDKKELEPIPTPHYGFFGRDVDILQIERHLAQHNVLLIRGMGGAGKTMLLHHLRHWWQETNWVEKTFYFGYDQMPFTRDWIVADIAQALWGESYYRQLIQPKMPDEQAKLVAKKLCEKRHLLILDNLESATGDAFSTFRPLADEEQPILRDWLASLVGGQTFVVVGSRSAEKWLTQNVLRSADRYNLRGIDPTAQTELTQYIAKKLDVVQYLKEEKHAQYLQQLLRLLAGNPLTMTIVLNNLRDYSPRQILIHFQKSNLHIDPYFDKGSRTESLIQCIEYGYQQFNMSDRNLLFALLPFQHMIRIGNCLNLYIEYLQTQPVLKTWQWNKLHSMLDRSIEWGLLQPHQEENEYYYIHPALVYYLATHLSKRETDKIHHAIKTAFFLYYTANGKSLVRLAENRQLPANYKPTSKDKVAERLQKMKRSENRLRALTLITLDEQNFLQALQYALDDRAQFWWMFRPIWFYWSVHQRHEDIIALATGVLKEKESYSRKQLEGEIGEGFNTVQSHLVASMREIGDYRNADSINLDLISSPTPNNISNKKKIRIQAQLLFSKGETAQKQGQFNHAKQQFQAGLQLLEEIGDRENQSFFYHHLGMVAKAQKQWQEANPYYQEALAIFKEFKMIEEQAPTLNELGRVAEAQKKWKDAKIYYGQAHTIYSNANNFHKQALVLQNLGALAEAEGDWDSAEKRHQQSLSLYKKLNDLKGQANGYQLLALLTFQQQQWESAEKYAKQALKLYKKLGDKRQYDIYKFLLVLKAKHFSSRFKNRR